MTGRSPYRPPISSRFMEVRGGRHAHAAWESQPLLQSTARTRGHPIGLVVIAFLLGVALGLIA